MQTTSFQWVNVDSNQLNYRLVGIIHFYLQIMPLFTTCALINQKASPDTAPIEQGAEELFKMITYSDIKLLYPKAKAVFSLAVKFYPNLKRYIWSIFPGFYPRVKLQVCYLCLLPLLP